MMRYLLAALVLTACSCSTAPIAPDAAQQMETIADTYGKARSLELDHCPKAPKCIEVRTAGYRAESAYVRASGERTRASIETARKAVLEFSDAAMVLR
jgi:hypothetical protein